MKRNILVWLFSAVLIAGFASTSIAEPPESDRPPSKEQMERVRERIETLRMWKLTKALDLDEKTSAQVFPLFNKYDSKRVKIEKALRNGMKELKDSLKDKREAQLKAVLDRLEKDHNAMQKLNDDERSELKNVLTVEQQARLIIFKQEFEREIRKIIAETKEKRADRLADEKVERPLPPKK